MPAPSGRIPNRQERQNGDALGTGARPASLSESSRSADSSTMGVGAQKSMWWWLGIVLVAALPSFLGTLLNHDNATFGMHYDDSIYYVGAKSLAQDGTFRLLSLPGEPASTKFPPFWPAYLSLAWKLDPSFPGNLKIATWLAWLPVPFYLAGVCWWFRRQGFSDRETVVLTLYCGCIPLFLFLAGSLMSEVFFGMLLFSVFVLVWDATTAGRVVVAGVVGGLAFLTRSAGLALLPAVVAVLLWRRRPKLAAAFAAGMLPAVLAWSRWSGQNQMNDLGDINLSFYTGYGAQMRAQVADGMLWEMLRENISLIPLEIGKMFCFIHSSDQLPNYLCHLTGIAALIGTARLGISYYSVFGAGLLGILVFWCYPPFERLVFPLFPLLTAGLYTLLRTVAGNLWKGLSRPLAERMISVAGLATIAAVFVWANWQNVQAIGRIPDMVGEARVAMQQRQTVYRWIQSQPEAFWIAWEDAELYLSTGQKAISLHPPTSFAYRGDRAGLNEWVASLPFPRGLPAPQRFLWTAGGFDLDTADIPSVHERIKRRLPPPLMQRGDLVVYPLEQVRAATP